MLRPFLLLAVGDVGWFKLCRSVEPVQTAGPLSGPASFDSPPRGQRRGVLQFARAQPVVRKHQGVATVGFPYFANNMFRASAVSAWMVDPCSAARSAASRSMLGVWKRSILYAEMSA
jgi:hypothetical protein